MSQVVEDTQPTLDQYGTLDQRVQLVRGLFRRNLIRDRYQVSEETLSYMPAHLAMSQKTGSPIDMAWHRFCTGCCHLWRGDLGLARQELRAALTLTEQAEHTLLQAWCLSQKNILLRRAGAVEEARRRPAPQLTPGAPATMSHYVATSEANQAWVAWRDGDLDAAEEHAHAALSILQSMSWVSWFWWMALWPLIGVMLARERLAEAIEYARPLLDETQERMPEAVERQVEAAIAAWEAGKADQAHNALNRAVELAEEAGYL
jgi:tetratricopeptide (TPR) repeat protein